MQTVIVFTVIALCVAFAIRHIARTFTSHHACCHCEGCPASKKTGQSCDCPDSCKMKK